MNYNEDFLKELDLSHIKEQYIRITLLNFQEEPIRSIEGVATQGSITVNGSSSIRRTVNLTMTVDTDTNDITNIDNLISINKKIKIEVGIKNPFSEEYCKEQFNMNKYEDIIWFKCGTFITSNATSSTSINNMSISINGKDKMTQLNGEAGGTLPASVTFHEIYTYDKNGNLVIEYPTIFKIIYELVTTFGEENGNNVIISDLSETGKQIVKYTGDASVYLYQNTNDKLSYNLKTNKPNSEYTEFLQDSLIGYIQTDATYPGELVFAAGATVTQVLDKIVQTLGGNYEYFYDLDGRFIFREIKNYLNNSYTPITTDLATGEIYYADFVSSSKYAYSFNDDLPSTQINVQPKYDNVKNDFVVWGNRQSVASGTTIPIRYRVAIDQKPQADRINYHMLNFDRYVDDEEDILLQYKHPIDDSTLYFYLKENEFDLNSTNYFKSVILPNVDVSAALAYHYFEIQKTKAGGEYKVEDVEKELEKINPVRDYLLKLRKIKSDVNDNKEVMTNIWKNSLSLEDFLSKKTNLTKSQAKYYYEILMKYYLIQYSDFPIAFYDPIGMKDLDIMCGLSYYLGALRSISTATNNSPVYLSNNEKIMLEDENVLGVNSIKDAIGFEKQNNSDQENMYYETTNYEEFLLNNDVNIALAAYFADRTDYFQDQIKKNNFVNYCRWLRRKKDKNANDFILNNGKTLTQIFEQTYYNDYVKFIEQVKQEGNYWFSNNEYNKPYQDFLKVYNIYRVCEDYNNKFYYVNYNSLLNIDSPDLCLAAQFAKKTKVGKSYFNNNEENLRDFIEFCEWVRNKKIALNGTSLQVNDFETNVYNSTLMIDSFITNYETQSNNFVIELETQYKNDNNLKDLELNIKSKDLCPDNSDYWKIDSINNKPFQDFLKVYNIYKTLYDSKVIEYLNSMSTPYYTNSKKGNHCFNNDFVRFCISIRDQKIKYLDLTSQTAVKTEIKLAVLKSYETMEGLVGQDLKNKYNNILSQNGYQIIEADNRAYEIYCTLKKYYDNYYNAKKIFINNLNKYTRNGQNPFVFKDEKESITHIEFNYLGAPCDDWREEIYRQALEANLYGENYTNYDEELIAEWRKLYDPSDINFIENGYWTDNVIYNPASLNYWLDFIDTSNELCKYSVNNIGRRMKVDNNKNVSVLWNINYPDIVYLNQSDNNKEIIKKYKQSGQPYCIVSSNLYKNISQGSLKSSAIDAIRNLLYQHLNYMTQVSITCLPKYYLEPNMLININSRQANVYGDYVIKQFTLPLTYNGTMSITCSQALTRI